MENQQLTLKNTKLEWLLIISKKNQRSRLWEYLTSMTTRMNLKKH
jgi:hypothetical protein